LGDRSTGEVTTQNNNFRYEAIFNAIVEHFSQAMESQWMVKPNIRQEKEIEVG
jgi:hypothetical protein